MAVVEPGGDVVLFFFFISLLLSLVVSSALLACLVKSLQINWDRRNRRPISYLAPVLLTFAFIGLTSFLTAPRLLDTVTLMTKSYVIEEISLKQDDIRWSTFYSGKRRFFFNQWQFEPAADKVYRISYTPRSRYVVDMTEVVEPAAAKP
jgi:predicted PurR-regulated permease PerM